MSTEKKQAVKSEKPEKPIVFTSVKDSKMAKYQDLVVWAKKQMYNNH